MCNFPKFNLIINLFYTLLIATQAVAIIFLCVYIPALLPLTITFLCVWLSTILAVVCIMTFGRSKEINLSLTLMVIALPIVGIIIYCISQIKGKECGKLTLCGTTYKTPLGKACYSICGTSEVGYDSTKYLKSGEEFFTCLFRDIEKSTKSIYLEYYIISRGEIFNRLVCCLQKAKNNGAEIKIIIDGIGSAFKIGRKEMKRLKTLGVEVKFFNRLTPLIRSQLNFRDHRKIAVIDSKIAYIGGINIADEYANIDSPFGYWKDTSVRICGSAAKVFEGMLLSLWLGSFKVEVENSHSQTCLPYCDSPLNKIMFAENAFVLAINNAVDRVHIFTPYFCAGEKIRCALEFAALRGVDVKIVLPNIPDKKYAFELSKTYAYNLIKKGVKFYLYTPGFMHAKSMICDDNLFIGSYNFDFRSMNLNYECGAIFSGEICEEAERDFKECVRLSKILKVERLSLKRKFVRFALNLFAPLV